MHANYGSHGIDFHVMIMFYQSYLFCVFFFDFLAGCILQVHQSIVSVEELLVLGKIKGVHEMSYCHSSP